MADPKTVEVWEKILRECEPQGDTPPPQSGLFVPLNLEIPSISIGQRARRLRERNPALIEQTLQEVIKRLVAGTAPWPLFLYGKAGCGKTCASWALLDYVSLNSGVE